MGYSLEFAVKKILRENNYVASTSYYQHISTLILYFCVKLDRKCAYLNADIILRTASMSELS